MKALVLISGGVDSTTCLALAVKKYGHENVIGLSIFYGQRHDKEIKAANAVCNYYKVELITLDLSTMFQFSNCSLLQHTSADIPEESYAKQIEKTNGKPVSTYVPFRNGLFLASASAIALSKGCSKIYYGAHSDDAAGNAYPDCSQQFNEAMNTAIYEGSGRQLSIEAPFIGLNKAGVVKIGLELAVPYELTWSCYEGHEHACGKCGTCIDRINAFKLNGVNDPIEYNS